MIITGNISLDCCREAADENSERAFRQIDCECESCLYEAGKIAVEEVLMHIIKNELDEEERSAVMLKWFKNKSVRQIAARTGETVKTVRRALRNGENKIYRSLKYVVLYDRAIGGREMLPDDFRFKIINCENGKELLS